MIYFDNSATTIKKPETVARAVAHAINHFGNAGRSFYDAVLLSNREILSARQEIAELVGLRDPMCVAFTSSSTESLNLVVGGLISRGDSVITTVTEHNSVLRPLYLRDCDISFIDCDDDGRLIFEMFDSCVKPDTKYMLCTHGSNVTGNVTDARGLYERCRARGITLILDVSQTLGVIPVEIDMADIFCFTGHKGLFGPQGTGGIITNGHFDFRVVKTGGLGVNSFLRLQSGDMPDIFEAGTANSHGIAGLRAGVHFINETGITAIHAKEKRLINMFCDGIKNLHSVKIYGDISGCGRLPVISINIGGYSSSELAERLWEDYSIATRSGSHCAPLLHKRFRTVDRGMVRFSFSYFNTEEEIEKGIAAIHEIANQ